MASHPLASVDEQAINIRDMPDLVAQVEGALDRGEGFTLFTLNLDHLVKRRQDKHFRALYARARFVTADGWPVVRLARRLSTSIKRTAGADMVIPLCRAAAKHGHRVMLFGSTPDVLSRSASRLRVRCPGLKIVECVAPPFGFDPLGADGHEGIMSVKASDCNLCFVALGAPKQEMFSDRASAMLPKVGFVCIGAGLDFIAGRHRRAPRFVQYLNLEWAWRLLLQPRRLGLRYVQCALLYVQLVLFPGSRDLGPAKS